MSFLREQPAFRRDEGLSASRQSTTKLFCKESNGKPLLCHLNPTLEGKWAVEAKQPNSAYKVAKHTILLKSSFSAPLLQKSVQPS